MKTIHK